MEGIPNISFACPCSFQAIICTPSVAQWTPMEGTGGDAGEGVSCCWPPALPSVSTCTLVLILASFPTPRGRLQGRIYEQGKALSPPYKLYGPCGHVQIRYKHDVQGQGSVNSDITEENLQENLVPGREQRRLLQTACEQ